MQESRLPDQNAYPQFQESIVNNATAQNGSFSLAAFRHHPAVHHRPGKLLSSTEMDGGCTFTFAVQARESRLSASAVTATLLRQQDRYGWEEQIIFGVTGSQNVVKTPNECKIESSQANSKHEKSPISRAS